MGIYYSAPLLGASIGPFLGGVFAQAFGWRAVFYFMLIAGGIVWISLFVFLKDTFRKERSLQYQTVFRRSLEQPQLSTAAPGCNSATEQQLSMKKAAEQLETGMTADSLGVQDVKLSFTDVNPFPPMIVVLKRLNNNAIFLTAGRCIAQ